MYSGGELPLLVCSCRGCMACNARQGVRLVKCSFRTQAPNVPRFFVYAVHLPKNTSVFLIYVQVTGIVLCIFSTICVFYTKPQSLYLYFRNLQLEITPNYINGMHTVFVLLAYYYIKCILRIGW